MRDDEDLLCIQDNHLMMSMDEGATWTRRSTLYDGTKPGIPRPSLAFLKSRDGVLVLVYTDSSTMVWEVDDSKEELAFLRKPRLDVWTIRSLDGGKSWRDRQRIMEGWCGAFGGIIQTRSGQIVAAIQNMLLDPVRHVVLHAVSTDNGQTWTLSNSLDIGGSGHHDGLCEQTLIERIDGQLWILIRSNYDRFWEAVSDDEGSTWRLTKPSRIDASSSPGYMTRLASGRLALVWNRLYPEGMAAEEWNAKPYGRRGGSDTETPHYSVVSASWQRQELSIAFSQDEGNTWSRPQAIVGEPNGRIAYPYLFERRPGEIWLSVDHTLTWDDANNQWATTDRPVRLLLREEEFIVR